MQIRKLAHVKYRDFSQVVKRKIFIEKKYTFIFFTKNIDCGYMLEAPRRCGSNVYSQSIVGAKIRKIGIPQFCYVKYVCIHFTDMLS